MRNRVPPMAKRFPSVRKTPMATGIAKLMPESIVQTKPNAEHPARAGRPPPSPAQGEG